MFAVIFEVTPKPERWDDYLHHAGLLRPELEKIDGFISNDRFTSLGRPGWLLSLSIWRDEKAVIRWRTLARHHESQEKGRFEVFGDYHLRVGEITSDTGLALGESLAQVRFDETETGAAKHAIISERTFSGVADDPDMLALAARFGLADPHISGLVGWDVFRHLQRRDDFLLLASWRDADAAGAWVSNAANDTRHRCVRIIRDYGMFDRREAPQYYAAVERV